MSLIGMIFGWLFAVVFGILTLSMVLLSNWLQAGLLLIVVLLCLPPVSTLIENRYERTIHPLLRIGCCLPFPKRYWAEKSIRSMLHLK